MTEAEQERAGVVRERMLAEQKRDWPIHLEGARKYGNPYATLCRHCFGRHEPPRDEICPRTNIEGRHAPYAIERGDHLALTHRGEGR